VKNWRETHGRVGDLHGASACCRRRRRNGGSEFEKPTVAKRH
jgi:hypothetical protein